MRRFSPSVVTRALSAILLAGSAGVVRAGGALVGESGSDLWDLTSLREAPPDCKQGTTPRIRGLLVGVGSYLAPQGGAPAAAGFEAAGRNPALIRDALLQVGAKREELELLVNGDATEQATAEAMERLVRATMCKDLVVFAFSGRTRSSSSELALLLHDDVRLGRPLRPAVLRRFVAAVRNRRAFALVIVDASGTEPLELASTESVWRWTPGVSRELSPDAGDFAGAYAGSVAADQGGGGAAVGLLSWAFAKAVKDVVKDAPATRIRDLARAMDQHVRAVRGPAADDVFEASDADVAPFLLGKSGKRGFQLEDRPPPKGPPGKQYALLIANWKYEHLDELTTPAKDVDDVSVLLRDRFGFELTLPALREGERPYDLVLRNASGTAIKKALNQLAGGAGRVGPNDTVLVYYAGHGYFDAKLNKGWWQGVDAEKNDDALWVSNSDVVDHLKKMVARHVLIVADSCWANKMARRGNDAKPIEAPERANRIKVINAVLDGGSRNLLASGVNEPVADTGGKGHSVFAEQFLRWLKDYDDDLILASELRDKLRLSVVGAGQLPALIPIEDAGGDGGDFVFFRKPAANPSH